MLRWIETTLERFGVRFDVYFSEAELAAKGEIDAAVERLREAGASTRPRARCGSARPRSATTRTGSSIRSNGRHTYFGADCAYIVDKFSRGFDHLVYVLGRRPPRRRRARQGRGARRSGYDPDALEIVLYQWVSFLRDGEPVPMSKRSGNFITLDELIDEVGADAARFHLLLFSNDSTMNFDIEAVKRRSMDNPVYYVQYGHARIASILAQGGARGRDAAADRDGRPVAAAHRRRDSICCGRSPTCPGRSHYAAELRAPHRADPRRAGPRRRGSIASTPSAGSSPTTRS